MRIVSLLPAATEWLCAFGAADQIVGRSHECDYPSEVQPLPVVTRSTFGDGGDSAAIDRAVRDTLGQGLSLYDVDLDALRDLDPDLVVTQAQCEVCAVSLDALEAALADWTGGQPEIFSSEPSTFKQVLDSALRLGRQIGRAAEAMAFVAERERELRLLRERIGARRDGTVGGREAPTVVCIEWIEPLMTAGHWMPDLVELAGGRALAAEGGQRSAYVEWDEIVAADPDVLAVAACGFTVEQSLRDLRYLTERPEWPDLRAVREGRAFVLDGNAYFNRPGPRLYRSVELLAAVLHEGAGVDVEPWEVVPVGSERADALAS
jgi:iron complex transport system substrate-binding protein